MVAPMAQIIGEGDPDIGVSPLENGAVKDGHPAPKSPGEERGIPEPRREDGPQRSNILKSLVVAKETWGPTGECVVYTTANSPRSSIHETRGSWNPHCSSGYFTGSGSRAGEESTPPVGGPILAPAEGEVGDPPHVFDARQQDRLAVHGNGGGIEDGIARVGQSFLRQDGVGPTTGEQARSGESARWSSV